MQTLQMPLNNGQLELLDLFSLPIPNESLAQLKDLLLQFKFDQLEKLANKEWDEKRLDDKSMETRLKAHLRTPYRSQERFLKLGKETL
jgi:hypothetical protein